MQGRTTLIIAHRLATVPEGPAHRRAGAWSHRRNRRTGRLAQTEPALCAAGALAVRRLSMKHAGEPWMMGRHFPFVEDKVAQRRTSILSAFTPDDALALDAKTLSTSGNKSTAVHSMNKFSR